MRLKKPRVLDYHKNYIDGNLVLILARNFSVNLQCCHDNFPYTTKMVSRFENVTDYEPNLSLMISTTNQKVYS